MKVKRNIIKYILAIWFSILLLLGNTPMDFIHLFAHHKDTVHHFHKGLAIEKKHHHCAFLSLTLTSFINDHQEPVALFTSPEYFIRHAAISSNYIQRSIVAVSLRGPPAA
jgi:hypothetical protein